MKKFFGMVLLAAGVLGLILGGRLVSRRSPQRPYNPPAATQTARFEIRPGRTITNPAASQNPLGRLGAAEMTAGQKSELAGKFTDHIRPAVEKWMNAYEGRVPFRTGDLALDRFTERLGVGDRFYLYTFVFDGNTLTVQESSGRWKVSYLMNRASAVEMNRLPAEGRPPDPAVPVTRDEVIRMVKADSGIEFKPSEVVLKPTGLATAMNGGAFVSLLPAGADPNNGLSSRIELVFRSDGKLVHYDRDPFF